MLRIYLIFQAVMIFSCTTTKSEQNHDSEWANLQNAERVGCIPWPATEKELEVTQVQPTYNTDPFGFLTSVRQRSGNIIHTYIPHDGGTNLDTDKALSLPLGGRSLTAGAAAVGSLKVFFVVHNRAAQTALEVRSLADNRVLAKAPFVLSDDVTEASLTVDENIFWLTLHVSETDASYVKVTYNKGTWSFLKARFQTDSRGAQLVMDRDSHSAYIIEGAPISDEKVGIKVKSIGNNGEINRNDVVEFDVKGGLESWSATNGRGEVLVAMITGDSMVGQSTMHIAALNIKQEVPLWGWRKELLMPDIHVSEPVWIESPSGGAMLTLMKWLDGEATIGLYRVASGVLKTFPDQGVHRKGSIVTSGFMELGQKRVTTIIRHREGELWKFELCSGKI